MLNLKTGRRTRLPVLRDLNKIEQAEGRRVIRKVVNISSIAGLLGMTQTLLLPRAVLVEMCTTLPASAVITSVAKQSSSQHTGLLRLRLAMTKIIENL
jgi:hypothetical protein